MKSEDGGVAGEGLGCGDGESDDGGLSGGDMGSGLCCGTGEVVLTNSHSRLGSRLMGVAMGERV